MANKITRDQAAVGRFYDNLQHNDNLQNNLRDSDSFPDSWR